MVIVITSSFITQLRSWDFIFIPRGLTVFEKFEEKMLCVSQALVVSEVGDWRSASATQNLPLTSLPPLATGHSLCHFLLKGQSRVGSHSRI